MNTRGPIPPSYKSRIGRYRTYATEAEALEYEAGFDSYPTFPDNETPASLAGFFDAEDERVHRDDARAERARA